MSEGDLQDAGQETVPMILLNVNHIMYYINLFGDGGRSLANKETALAHSIAQPLGG